MAYLPLTGLCQRGTLKSPKKTQSLSISKSLVPLPGGGLINLIHEGTVTSKESVDEAIADSTAGDLVWIGPGTNILSSGVFKAGLHIHAENGAVMFITNTPLIQVSGGFFNEFTITGDGIWYQYQDELDGEAMMKGSGAGRIVLKGRSFISDGPMGLNSIALNGRTSRLVMIASERLESTGYDIRFGSAPFCYLAAPQMIAGDSLLEDGSSGTTNIVVAGHAIGGSGGSSTVIQVNSNSIFRAELLDLPEDGWVLGDGGVVEVGTLRYKGTHGINYRLAGDTKFTLDAKRIYALDGGPLIKSTSGGSVIELKNFTMFGGPLVTGNQDGIVRMQNVTTNNVSRFDSLDIGANLSFGGTLNGVKVYRANLTQNGGSAPTATVFENSLGGTLVWTRNSAGDFTGTLAGTFPANKCWMTPRNDYNSKVPALVTLTRKSANTVSLTSDQDGVLVDQPVLILVYP